MPNNLYQQLNNNNNNNPLSQNSSLRQISNNLDGFQQMINQFNNFKNSFQGNPQQIVQQLLQSGKMSQAEYNQLSQMALQFKNLFYKG